MEVGFQRFVSIQLFWWSILAALILFLLLNIYYKLIRLNVKKYCPILLSSTCSEKILRSKHVYQNNCFRLRAQNTPHYIKQLVYTVWTVLHYAVRVLFQVLSSILQSSGTLRPSMSGLERSATAHSGRARSLIQVTAVFSESMKNAKISVWNCFWQGIHWAHSMSTHVSRDTAISHNCTNST